MLQLLDHDTARRRAGPSDHRGLERLDRASAVALRLLVLGAALAVAVVVLVRLRLVVLPVALALTLATVLVPPVARCVALDFAPAWLRHSCWGRASSWCWPP